MRFRAGVTTKQALEVLRDAQHRLGNSRSAAGDGAQLRDSYIRTVDSIERQFINIFASTEEADGLLTARYWQLMSLDDHQLKLNVTIQSEIDRQVLRVHNLIEIVE